MSQRTNWKAWWGVIWFGEIQRPYIRLEASGPPVHLAVWGWGAHSCVLTKTHVMPHSVPRDVAESIQGGQDSPSCGKRLWQGWLLTWEFWNIRNETNPSFCFSRHRCWPTYNTVMWLGASGSLTEHHFFLRVSLGNCLIKPQVQGLLSIHLISGRLFCKVVSALLYCSTMFVLFSGWGLIFFSAFAQYIQKNIAL